MGLVRDGDGWVWLERAGFFWICLGFSGFGGGGDRWSGFFGFGRGGDRWSGFFWVWSGWRSVVGVVIFVGEGWVFLGLIGVEIGGRFCTV